MHRRLQFGMRENPASERRHGSRQTACSSSDSMLADCTVARSEPPIPALNGRSPDTDSPTNAAPPHAATGVEKLSTPTHPTVSERSLSSVTIQRDFEPLIGSYEAARLLGNIHVKTLQRYARQQRIPGYQIGGHWYFRASELDSWLRSRLNSSCHPCRLQEGSDGT